jgi:polar amino acid transport system substrate-binding protein
MLNAEMSTFTLKSPTWRHMSVIICLLFLSAAAGAGTSGPGMQTTLQRVSTDDLVRIGYANEAPFAYMDIVSGRVTGEAPEVARAVLSRMGIHHVESVLTEFGSLIPGLQAGRFDIIAAGMYILPERCRQVRFSNPSYSTGEAFLVRHGNPDALHSYGDVLKHPHVLLGVVTGAVEIQYAHNVGIPPAQLVYFPDGPSAVEGLVAKRIDAYAASRPAARDLAGKAADQGVELAVPFADPVAGGRPVRGYGAFGFRLGDAGFADAFNRGLRGFIGSDAHRKLVAPFGFTAQELPGNANAQSLCERPGGRPG